jgi:hypothetical protein
MKLFWVCLGALLAAGTVAFAGSHAEGIVESAQIVMSPDQTTSPTTSNWVIPVAIFALLVGAAALSGDSDGSGAS